MTKPLALVFYQGLLTGNRMVNRLRELGYRTALVKDLSLLGNQAAVEKPLVVVVELGDDPEPVLESVRVLRFQEETSHIPVLAITRPSNRRQHRRLSAAAQAAGISILAEVSGVLAQLPELLDHLLQVE